MVFFPTPCRVYLTNRVLSFQDLDEFFSAHQNFELGKVLQVFFKLTTHFYFSTSDNCLIFIFLLIGIDKLVN